MEDNNYAVVFERGDFTENIFYPLKVVGYVLGKEKISKNGIRTFVVDEKFKEKICNDFANSSFAKFLLTSNTLNFMEDNNSLNSKFVYGSPCNDIVFANIISHNSENKRKKGGFPISKLQKMYSEALKEYDFSQLIIEGGLSTYAERKEPLSEMYFMDEVFIPAFSDDLGMEIPENIYEEETFKQLPEKINIKEIYEKCKKYIIAQDEHILPILAGINDNLMAEMPEEKTNILVCGSTGVGKTALFKKIAELVGIPIVIENSTQFTKAGYVGRNVDDIFEDLLEAANHDLELAQRGIIIIDEIDKKASGKDDSVSGLGVLQSMLKLLEGGDYTYEVGQGGYSELKTFNTLKTTIAFGGAFSGLEDQISKKTIGFDKKETPKASTIDIYSVENMEKYGIPPEFVGRLQLIEKFNNLSVEDLKKILLEAIINPYSLFVKKMKKYNTLVKNDEDFINAVAEEAYRRRAGARGLYSTMKDTTKIAESEIILLPNYSKELILTPECVNDNTAYTLKRVYKNRSNSAKQY